MCFRPHSKMISVSKAKMEIRIPGQDFQKWLVLFFCVPHQGTSFSEGECSPQGISREKYRGAQNHSSYSNPLFQDSALALAEHIRKAKNNIHVLISQPSFRNRF